MSEQHFQVVFRGRRVEGSDPVEVKEKLARLFKTTLEQINPMFTGKRVVIKKAIDEATARKYQAAMQQAGAVAEIEPMALEPAPAEAEARDIHPPAHGELDAISLAEFGSTLTETHSAPPPDIDTSGISMAAVGETIIEAEPTQAPDIDTHALSMSDVGETLREYAPVDTPEIDTSGMSVGDFGETLAKEKKVEAPDIDISSLHMDGDE